MSGRLTMVVCGAPLAARAAEVAERLTAVGWTVTVVRSAAAEQWCPGPAESGVPSRPAPAESAAGRPRPDQVVAFPLSFNTANKVAAGVMDTPVCGVLCDALGASVPVTAVVMVNDRLWGHPVWPSTLTTLTRAGVRFVDSLSGRLGAPRAVRSGSGGEVVASFEPAWLVDALAS